MRSHGLGENCTVLTDPGGCFGREEGIFSIIGEPLLHKEPKSVTTRCISKMVTDPSCDATAQSVEDGENAVDIKASTPLVCGGVCDDEVHPVYIVFVSLRVYNGSGL